METRGLPPQTSYRSLIRSIAADSGFALIAQLLEIERSAARWTYEGAKLEYSSHAAIEVLASATASSLRLSGWDVRDEEARAVTAGSGMEGSSRTAGEGRGYAELIRLVLAQGKEVPFLESQIKYFHSLLLKHVPDAAGYRRIYRKPGERVAPSERWGLGEAPPGEICADEMARLVGWARAEFDAGEIPSLLVIALFLHQFVVLRPFTDANGRLARVLAAHLLVRTGYDHIRFASLDAAVEARKDECQAALRQSAAGDVTPWVIYFLSVVADTQRSAYAMLPSVMIGPRQERILAELRERGAAKIGDLIAALGIPRATAKKDLKGLLQSGHATATGIGKGTVYRPGRRG